MMHAFRSAIDLRCRVLFCLVALLIAPRIRSDEATFYRGINLNGPPTTIDGRHWEGGETTNLVVNGIAFENQSVPLKPPADRQRSRMLRSSRTGSKLDIELTAVPDGAYQVFIYLWEDNHSEQYSLLVNDRQVLENAYSGNAGTWRKLGPWNASPSGSKIKISARTAGHSAVNLSGIEVWRGEGSIPIRSDAKFATVLTPEHTEFFERRIRPLLVGNCYECHRAGAKKIGANLLLDSRAGIMKGGDTGPVITPGDPEASLLIQAIRHTDPHLTMPPEGKLSPQEIVDLETWVRMGAPDPRTNDTVAIAKAKTAIDWEKAREFWSFRPLQFVPPPDVKDTGWPFTPVDRFTLARLEQAGIAPAPDAHKHTLIRRATYDLIGLPPTPEEIDAFLADQSPDAFANVINRLLDSPRYGERWGRHWLDVVRYADSAGDNSDFPIPQMYRYRDWVIRAFNRDLPYDQFIREQIAGDLLGGRTTEEVHERLIATGYIANSRRFGSRVDDYPQHLTIEDTIDNLGRAFLGLTVSCARCHDHKFDPITSADYYALYGIFHSTRYPWPGIELDKKQRDLVPLVPDEIVAAAQRAHREKQKALESNVKGLEEQLKAAEGNDRKELETSLAQAKKALDFHNKSPLPIEQAYALADAKKIEDVPIQQRGDPAQPGELVRRRFLTILGGAVVPPDDTTSGRLHLAQWIVDPNNPLPARVMANRIWLYHFGRGLVPTPNDFGKQGKPPTHPELLDWLASTFIDNGWSIKSMHRLIMLSRTYQLASRRSEEAISRDPNNELLASFPRRRIDAEAMRDTLLVLGGNLDTTRAGPHPFPPQPEWNFTQHNPFKAVYDTNKRSVYLMTQRIQRHPYMAVFDGADPAASTPVRTATTTPLQALYLLNDRFVHDQSQRFAERLLFEADDDNGRLIRAYQLALGRPPTPDELDRSRSFLVAVSERLRAEGSSETRVAPEAWHAMARVIFRLNELVYID